MPEVVIIDEIGNQLEAEAARTIAERGRYPHRHAHGTSLENLIINPALSDLVGGIGAVTLGRRRSPKAGDTENGPRAQGTSTFQIIVELQELDRFAIHFDVAKAVDQLLRGHKPEPQIRQRTADGSLADSCRVPGGGRDHLVY